MNPVRVAIADDSAFLRQAVQRMLEPAGGVAVVGLASSGEDLLDHLDAWRPDVIILDLAMPGLGGLATLDAVMACRPTPVLILSIHSKPDAPLTREALQRGAVDFVDKQQYSLVDFERLRAVLLDKIGRLSRAVPGAGASAGGGAMWAVSPASPAPRSALEVALLGASTGGPPAIEAILRDLDGGLPVPVVIVQHMPAGFTRSFADRLDAALPIAVHEVAHDELLVGGVAYVAPGGFHLRLRRGSDGLRGVLSTVPEGAMHRPSIDLLFASAVEVVGARAVAVVLTGMGHDGAAGIAALARAGAHTIAQDEATSVVYGMPRSALDTGGVREVLPLPFIGGRLRALARRASAIGGVRREG